MIGAHVVAISRFMKASPGGHIAITVVGSSPLKSKIAMVVIPGKPWRFYPKDSLGHEQGK